MKGYWFFGGRLRCKAQSSFLHVPQVDKSFSPQRSAMKMPLPPIPILSPNCPLHPPLPLTWWGQLIWLQVCVHVCASTQNDDLGLALDPHSCAGAGRDLYAVLHPRLQPAHHHWTDGCVHWLIDVVAGLVGQAPNLTEMRHRGRQRFTAARCHSTVSTSWCFLPQSSGPPCTPGWCHSADRRGAGPTTRWWTCCCGFPLSTPSPAGEGHRALTRGREEMRRLNVGDKREGIKRFSGRRARRSHCWIRMCLHSKVMQQSMFPQPAWQMANWTTLSQSRILMGESLFLSKATGSKKKGSNLLPYCAQDFFSSFFHLAGIKSYPYCK